MISSESFVLNFLKVYNVTDMNSTSYRDVFYSILTSIHLCSGSEHFRYIPVLCRVWKGLWGWDRKQPMTVCLWLCRRQSLFQMVCRKWLCTLYNIFQYFYSLIHGSLTRIQFPKQEQDVSLFLMSFWKVKQTSFWITS